MRRSAERPVALYVDKEFGGAILQLRRGLGSRDEIETGVALGIGVGHQPRRKDLAVLLDAGGDEFDSAGGVNVQADGGGLAKSGIRA